MSVLGAGKGGDAGFSISYPIANSLRIRAAGTTYLNRTFGTPTTNTTWSLSFWMKVGTINSAYRGLFLVNSGGAQGLYLGPSDNLILYGSSSILASGSGVVRDPSAWYHVFIRSNGTNVVCYINGSQTFSYTGTVTGINSAIAHIIGKNPGASTELFDGYLSEINFVDGQALTPSSFGVTNSDGVWVAKKYAGTYGNNGFYLPFSNGSSTTTLGYDYQTSDRSGTKNDWTCNNISLTAGAAYDWMTDTPTNNFAVSSYLLNDSVRTLSEANLKFSYNFQAQNGGSTLWMESGKWYMEATVIASSGYSFALGIARQPFDWWHAKNWLPSSDTTNTSAYDFGTPNVGDTYAVAYDAGAHTVTFYTNNSQVSQLTGVSSAPACFIYNTISIGATGTLQLNFGQAPLHASAAWQSAAGGYFRYTPPTGFKALCTANLPAVAITAPKKHFDINTRVGTAATYSVTGIQFQPDFVWVKSRGRTVDHALYDANRGVQKRLETNNTDAEVTGDSTGLTAFNSDGYTGGALDQINGTTATNSFVDWLWKGGNGTVSNTSGSITSTVSANPTAGFSIVTYTGGATGATIGHGLGVKPDLIIIKCRGFAYSWPIFHKALDLGNNTNSSYLVLNSTAAKNDVTTGDAETVFGDGTNWKSPTSSLITLGSWGGVNSSSYGYVAYCFAEIPGFSKFGSYTGNGSADGGFVYTGFRPRYVLTKCVSTTGDWRIYDAMRPGYNVQGGTLLADTSGQETTATEIDFTANGFKLRVATDPNSAQTFVYAAFAESPFGGSNCYPAPAR